MKFLRREPKESPVYRKAKRRLETVSSEEILRYTDNTHSALGQTVAQIRNSLNNRKAEEAVVLMEELHTGAETIKAAASVLLSRHEEVQVK